MPRPPLVILFLFALSAVLLVIFGTLVFSNGKSTNAPNTPAPTGRTAPEVTIVDPVRGATNVDAPTIVVFGDYQCPYCRDLEATIAALLARRSDVRVVWKNLPLRREHPLAQAAAEAALCAGRQGAHWEMHDLLMTRALPASPELYAPLAEEIGLDAEAFRSCLLSGTAKPLVDRTVEEALALDIDGVPYVFAGTQRFSGFIGVDALLAALAAAQ